MSEKPNVFPTKEQIESANETGSMIAEQMENQSPIEGYVTSKEEAAAMEMKRRTEEQLRQREERLREGEAKANELEKQREEQLRNSTPGYIGNNQQPPVVPPNVMNSYGSSEPKKDPYIEAISQPQMNQPFDVIPLPSEGKLYPSKKKSVKVAFLTTADENILTSPNLLESGDFLEILINRKLLEPDLRYKDLLPGDRDAIMIWLRATGYGSTYPIQVLDRNNIPFDTEVDLNELKTVNLTVEPDADGLFSFKLPNSGHDIRFKLLTVGDVDEIVARIDDEKQAGVIVNNEPTYVLEKQIVSVNGNTDRVYIRDYVNNIRTLDAQPLREYIGSIESGIDLTVEVRTPGGGSLKTFLPLNLQFFWPNAQI